MKISILFTHYLPVVVLALVRTDVPVVVGLVVDILREGDASLSQVVQLWREFVVIANGQLEMEII